MAALLAGQYQVVIGIVESWNLSLGVELEEFGRLLLSFFEIYHDVIVVNAQFLGTNGTLVAIHGGIDKESNGSILVRHGSECLHGGFVRVNRHGRGRKGASKNNGAEKCNPRN